jgi:hypothetical protein
MASWCIGLVECLFFKNTSAIPVLPLIPLRKTGHEAGTKADDEYVWHQKLNKEWQE